VSPGGDVLRRLGARFPLIQAPMAGAGGVELAAAVIGAGGVGSLPCALLSAEAAMDEVAEVRARHSGPLNLNFFCHTIGPAPDESAWRAALAPFYVEEGVGEPETPPPLRRPFDEAMCTLVERTRPEIVSFHFGLPEAGLLERVRATGALVIGNATNVEEARWLAGRRVDAIIAQAFEAGGHAGWFLDAHRPVGLAALVPQVVAAVEVPVIAAGGIATPAGIAAAFALGASAVQVGTAYLATPESSISPIHRALLGTPAAADTAFTTLFSGRSARGVRNRLMRELGPESAAAPPFPYASALLAPLRAAAERQGRGDYSPLWAGQSAPLVRKTNAAALTHELGGATLAAMGETA
jgi:nitronate monooxygenase